MAHELRQLGWNGKIGIFLHVPFPPAEIFTVLPWAAPLLEMVLDYDLFGLQTRRYERNLLDSLTAELHGHVMGKSFIRDGRSLRASTFPIGIDAETFERMASQREDTPTGRFLRNISPAHQIILGVDRLDYTKGVVQRLRTFEYLLERYPALRGKVTFIQISAPSRSRVPEYVEERQQVDQLVGRINGRFSDAAWVPVHYLYRSIPQAELVAFYREAEVGLITPLRDGMNLVAKEFVASQGDDPGILVLSKFCGAAETMREAMIVNPYDIEGTAAAIHRALRMSRRERRSRWDALVQDIRRNSADAWSDGFLEDLESGEPIDAPRRAGPQVHSISVDVATC
jgi:trehalose-6-phosphate synthase